MTRRVLLTPERLAAVSRIIALRISNPAPAVDIVPPVDVVVTTAILIGNTDLGTLPAPVQELSLKTHVLPILSGKSMNVILQLALNYLKSHPEVVEKLVAEFFDAVIAEIRSRNKE